MPFSSGYSVHFHLIFQFSVSALPVVMSGF